MTEPTFDHERLDESNHGGKSDLKRIVSIPTHLIQRTKTVAGDRTEYEYEYRDAEYEYDEDKAAKT